MSFHCVKAIEPQSAANNVCLWCDSQGRSGFLCWGLRMQGSENVCLSVCLPPQCWKGPGAIYSDPRNWSRSILRITKALPGVFPKQLGEKILKVPFHSAGLNVGWKVKVGEADKTKTVASGLTKSLPYGVTFPLSQALERLETELQWQAVSWKVKKKKKKSLANRLLVYTAVTSILTSLLKPNDLLRG